MKFKYNISGFLYVSECLAQNERKRRDVSGSGFNTLEDAELEQELEEINQKRANYLKGVLHPRLVFGLFLHFSQKLQHIGNK